MLGNKFMTGWGKRYVGLAAIAVLLFTVGCTPAPYASVRGRVTLDGVPLENAEVQFLPLPDQLPNHPSSSAYTDQDGLYAMEAQQSRGVLVGTHVVCINDAAVMMPTGGMAAVEDGSQPGPKSTSSKRRSRIPAIYSDASKTPFGKMVVQGGEQELNFELSAKP